MLDRPLHCDRRLLNMLLATLLVAPLSLAAQERDQAVDKPATKTGKAAPQDARPSDNPAALFDRLDRNNDGVLVADEIPEPQAKAFGRLIRIGDRNKDGRLTRQEFLSSLEPDRPATSDRRRPGQGRSVDPAQSFDRFDKNKDGKLTLDEFPAGVRERIAALLKQSGKDSMNREDFAKLYRSREVGNQGKKTRKRPESPRVQQPANDRARREQFFDRLDRNKDGQLTELEFPESSRGLFTFLARRLGKKPGESISRKEFIESLPSQRPGRSRPDQPGPERPRPGQPGERPRPDAPREAGRGPAIFRVLDLNRDGRISREELAKAAAQFEQLDTNRDGQLDPREFFGTRGSGERPPLRPDAGRPGQRPEARPGVRPQPPPRRPETTRGNDRPRTTRGQTTDRRLFERLDRDGNGRIEASEVPALLRDRLKRLDTNGDGRISPEEFSRGLKEGNQRLRERPPLPRRQPRERPRDEE